MSRKAMLPRADVLQAAIPQLHVAYPQVLVADVERAAAFYRDKLDFSLDYLYGQPPFYGLVSRDGVGLNLRHADGPVLDPRLRKRDRLLSAAIVVDGVEDLFHSYRARHVEFAQSLRHQPWGASDFIVRDSDGNLICFASRITQQD